MPLEQPYKTNEIPPHLREGADPPDDAALRDILAENGDILNPQEYSEISEIATIGLDAKPGTVAHALAKTIGEVRHPA